MTFGKRQLVIAALVAALWAAVYLNWQFSGNDAVEFTETETSSKQLGQTTYVNTEISTAEFSSSEKEESKKKSEHAKAVNSDDNSVDSGYFASERAKRSQSDAKAIETLSDIIEASSSSENAKKEAVSAAEKLALIIKAQSDIESEIKNKGFEDVFVCINNDNCNVSLYGGELDDASAIAVKDIVNRQAGIPFEKITVAQVK